MTEALAARIAALEARLGRDPQAAIREAISAILEGRPPPSTHAWLALDMRRLRSSFPPDTTDDEGTDDDPTR